MWLPQDWSIFWNTTLPACRTLWHHNLTVPIVASLSNATMWWLCDPTMCWLTLWHHEWNIFDLGGLISWLYQNSYSPPFTSVFIENEKTIVYMQSSIKSEAFILLKANWNHLCKVMYFIRWKLEVKVDRGKQKGEIYMGYISK